MGKLIEKQSGKNDFIKTAVIHAQLEIINPFDDRNGRIARMLITLFLYLSGVLHRPMFLSQYLENNKTRYYESLRNISQNNLWQEWIEFFLTTVKEQVKNNIKKVKEINRLYEHKSEEFKRLFPKQTNAESRV